VQVRTYSVEAGAIPLSEDDRLGAANPYIGNDLLVVMAINESSHPVRLTKVEVEFDRRGNPSSGPTSLFWQEFPGATLPGLIEPRDTGTNDQATRACRQCV
jgi:hypothetical protein